ncbi:hypothetical protein SY83_04595 [Paenibacillus swuensis]|uniref:HTH araC/xylS-type domain-containing protein n=1 Tax=Paenibacillus swuensis TaxID=1178515 RepID=A0A172TFP2_9BACL|nr:AraC family transcriptional regulator [Paenibacillus swuensis]ANE45697.1 hypothetical protein SY83_04595 [Paenibacillus swuensis]
MDIYEENIEYLTPLLSAKVVRIHKSGSRDLTRWNIHDETEIIYVLEGGMDMFIEQKPHTLLTGDVLLIGSRQLHRSQKHEDDLQYLVLQFDIKQYFDRNTMIYLPYFNNPLRPISLRNGILASSRKLRSAIGQDILGIEREAKHKLMGFEMAISNAIRNILFQIIRADPETAMVSPLLERLQPALEFIENHLSEKITTSEVCRQLNLSYDYTAHLFKKVIGLPMVDYINYRRIKLAEIFLVTRDISVAQTAQEAGIPNLPHFIQLFKRWNQMTPKAYQLKMNTTVTMQQTIRREEPER